MPPSTPTLAAVIWQKFVSLPGRAANFYLRVVS